MRPRKLSNKEMYELPDSWYYEEFPERGGWQNPKVDIKNYRPSIMSIWEVTKAQFENWKKSGGLCMNYNSKYYIA